MMSSNLPAAEAGGYPEQSQQDSWWLVKWSGWLATIGAVALGFFGSMAVAFNLLTLNIFSAIAGGLQVFAAAIILAIEGSSVVSFLTFAKPVGRIFEGRPLYVKTAVYAALTFLPLFIGAGSLAVILGVAASAGVTAIYALILIGRKGELDDMRAVAAEQPRI